MMVALPNDLLVRMRKCAAQKRVGLLPGALQLEDGIKDSQQSATVCSVLTTDVSFTVLFKHTVDDPTSSLDH